MRVLGMTTRILERMVRASRDNRDKDQDNRDNDTDAWEVGAS